MYTITNPEHPVILFIPEAGIYPYMRGLAVLGDAVVKQGGRVLVTRDTGQMLRSPMMAMYKAPIPTPQEQLNSITKANNKMLERVKWNYNFSFLELSEMVDAKDMKEIDKLTDVDDANLENIFFRGFPVGKISQYDFILETKFPYSSHLSSEHKALYKIYIQNTALAIAITDTICERYNPSLFLTFNEYAQCQGVRYSAEKHGVRRMAMTYPTHYNVDASRFMIWQSTCEYWRYTHCQKWSEGKNIPIQKKYVIECWKDAIFRMYSSGSHIFSSRKENDPGLIFEKLHLDPHRKTIVVYTSSQDERGSVEVAMNIWGEDPHIADAFPDQISWLIMLREYARKRNDIQIIVRIHPREGKRGGGFDSEHLQKLKAIFTENTSHFIIIWPDEPISSYDLMELADICLVAWSLMGQEAARLGIPVLSFTGNMFYPDDDFIQVATTREEYEKRLTAMVAMDYTWKYLIKAIRFYHWRIFTPGLDLSETVPFTFDDNAVWPRVPDSKIEVINDILSGKQDLIGYNLRTWQEKLCQNSFLEESEAIQEGIRRFIDKVFHPPYPYGAKFGVLFRVYRKVRKIMIRKFASLYVLKDSFKDYRLEYSAEVLRLVEFQQKTKQDHNLRILLQDGLCAVLIHKGRISRRMSPVIIRLAKLHAQASLSV